MEDVSDISEEPAASNFRANFITERFVLGRLRAEISVRRPATLDRFFDVFLIPSKQIPRLFLNWATVASFCILSSSLNKSQINKLLGYW
jgi:hypothetical protein